MKPARDELGTKLVNAEAVPDEPKGAAFGSPEHRAWLHALLDVAIGHSLPDSRVLVLIAKGPVPAEADDGAVTVMPSGCLVTDARGMQAIARHMSVAAPSLVNVQAFRRMMDGIDGCASGLASGLRAGRAERAARESKDRN